MGSAKRPMLEKVKTCKLYESRLIVQKLFVVAMNTQKLKSLSFMNIKLNPYNLA